MQKEIIQFGFCAGAGTGCDLDAGVVRLALAFDRSPALFSRSLSASASVTYWNC